MRTSEKDGKDELRFNLPKAWRRTDVLVASLVINVLSLALPIVILQIYDRIIPNQAIGTFGVLMAIMLVVILIDTALKIFRSMILSWEGAKFDHRESLKSMDHILKADTRSFDSKPTGFYLDKMQALEQVQEFFSGQSVLLLMDFPFVIIFLALIWVIAGPLVLIPVTLLLLFVLTSVITGRKLHETLLNRSEIEDRRQNFVIESLQGIHTIKSMAMESFMLRRYEKLQGQSAISVYDVSRISSTVQGVGASFSQLAVVSFVSIGSLFVLNGEITMGALAAGTMLSGRVLQPGLRAMALWTQFQAMRLSLSKVDELYALQSEVGGDFNIPEGIKGKIELRDVCFKYPTQKENLIDNISLTVEPGEAVGITGLNGAGKSTLIGIISGFISPDQGEIFVDGENVEAFDLRALRAQIGIVPQKGILFEGSILENMTLYREGNAIDEAVELAKMLGLDEVISRLPDGLDTQVGGAAVDTLSEGVKQNIVMVRSLVGHPKIILFDDANANFDLKNDNRLQKLMHYFIGKRTIVIVSHRPSFLRLCHKQFELKNGRLNEFADLNKSPQNKTLKVADILGQSVTA